MSSISMTEANNFFLYKTDWTYFRLSDPSIVCVAIGQLSYYIVKESIENTYMGVAVFQ
jgi:hypothetical protein